MACEEELDDEVYCDSNTDMKLKGTPGKQINQLEQDTLLHMLEVFWVWILHTLSMQLG